LTDLLSVKEAKEIILRHFSILDSEIVHLESAAGRVLAGDIVSEINLPQFTNSSMDGFAVRSKDIINASLSNPVELTVIDDIPAGKLSEVEIQGGQTVRIMTGAPIPSGADCVVPIEATDQYKSSKRADTRLPSVIKVFTSLKSGSYVRQAGEDIHSGERILTKGTRLHPADIGLMAMLGQNNLPVVRRPVVAFMSSGDELVPVDKPLTPGKIHDSNTYTLSAQISRDGAVPLNLGIASDQEESVINRLNAAISSNVDLIISTAGVSVGAFDLIKTVLSRYGEIEFWRVNMRPGKPLTFGNYKGIPFIGLPGNPVSAFVAYEIFIHSVIFRMSGLFNDEPDVISVTLGEPVKSDGRESYLRAIVTREEGRWIARLTGHQGSGNLRSLVQANALLIIPAGVKSLPLNSMVEAIFLKKNQFQNSY
jgi:molybdopterin molybdotransferase